MSDSTQIVNKLIDKLIEDNEHITQDEYNSLLSFNTLNMDPSKTGPLMIYLRDNFTDSQNKITLLDFMFIQLLIDKLDRNLSFNKFSSSNNNNKVFEHLQNAVRHCFKYKKRPDLISELKPETVKLLTSFSCLENDVVKLPVTVLSNLTIDQLASIDSIPNIKWSDEQKNAITMSRQRLASQTTIKKNNTNALNKNVKNNVPGEITSLNNSNSTVKNNKLMTSDTENLSSLSNKNSEVFKNRSSKLNTDNLSLSENRLSKTKTNNLLSSINKNNASKLNAASKNNFSELKTENSLTTPESLKTLSSVKNEQTGMLSNLGKDAATALASAAAAIGLSDMNTVTESKPSNIGIETVEESNPMFTDSEISLNGLTTTDNNLSLQKNALIKKNNNVVKSKAVIPFTENSTNEVDSMISEIKDKLSKLDTPVENIGIPDVNDKIIINDNVITISCLIKHITNNKLFSNSNDCDDTVKKMIDNNIMNMEKLIKMNIDETYDDAVSKYKQFYRLIVGMGKFIAESNEFKDLSKDQDGNIYQNNILDAFKEIIKAVLNYSQKFTDHFTVINDNIIKMNSDLLLLYTAATFKQVNLGVNINEINVMYQKVIQSIKDNLAIFEDAKKSVYSNGSKEIAASNSKSQELSQLTNELSKKLIDLGKQQEILNSNVKLLHERLPINNGNGVAKLAKEIYNVNKQ